MTIPWYELEDDVDVPIEDSRTLTPECYVPLVLA